MSGFYVLEPEEGMLFGRKWAYADLVDPVNYGEPPRCPVCGGPVGSREWLPPHRIKLSSAKPERWGDFVWGAGFPLLVSERFCDVYESEGLTGVTRFHSAAEIVRAGARRAADLTVPLPVYRLVDIVWNGANQDDAASGTVTERAVSCPYCRVGGGEHWQDRIVIEEGSWTGADIFTPRGAPASIMVSERFREVAERHRLKNLWLVPAGQYGYDVRRPGLWYVNRGDIGEGDADA